MSEEGCWGKGGTVTFLSKRDEVGFTSLFKWGMGWGEILSTNYIQIPFWRMGVGGANSVLSLYSNCYKGIMRSTQRWQTHE